MSDLTAPPPPPAGSRAPRVSILVPAASNLELLRACLRSLSQHLPTRVPVEVLVVLNGEEPTGELRAEFPSVEIIRPGVELGLAASANRARRQASGELLVVLHDDATIEPGWLEALLAAAEAFPRAGAIGCRVLGVDGRLQAMGGLIWRDGGVASRWRGAPPETELETPFAADFCGTCSLLVRAATWDAIGGFDESFFPVYYVDVDFAMSVRRLGQVVLLEPRARIRHRGGTSSGLRKRLFMTARNRRAFVEKWAEDLADHEPFVDTSEESLARGRARTAAWAAAEHAPRPLPNRSFTAGPLDEGARLAQRLAFERLYSASLEGELDAASQARQPPATPAATSVTPPPAAPAVDAAELAHLRQCAETLRLMEDSRWWRLYGRLLPLLRWIRRGRGA